MSQTFNIHTLHRGKYMTCFMVLLLAMGALASLIPISEIFRIIIVLCTIPGILFVAVKVSQRPSQWRLTDTELTITFADHSSQYKFTDIDHIRSLTRSGGNLYVIYPRKQRPARYWRNKLFQADDDQLLLHEALVASPIEYFRF